MSNADSNRPRIDYPCPWEYTVVGSNEELMRAGILSVMHGREHTLRLAHYSKNKKYCSLHVETRVQDEAERNRLFQELGKVPSVILVQ